MSVLLRGTCERKKIELGQVSPYSVVGRYRYEDACIGQVSLSFLLWDAMTQPDRRTWTGESLYLVVGPVHPPPWPGRFYLAYWYDTEDMTACTHLHGQSSERTWTSQMTRMGSDEQ